MRYRGDSDSHLVRGLVAIAIALFSGRTARAVLATDALSLFRELGLEQHLTPQRSNGVRSMFERIRADATNKSRSFPQASRTGRRPHARDLRIDEPPLGDRREAFEIFGYRGAIAIGQLREISDFGRHGAAQRIALRGQAGCERGLDILLRPLPEA